MTLSCTISEFGISAPSYSEIVAGLKAEYFAIFGEDAYLANDSQDGQLLGVFASAINDNNQATIQTFNSFSPQYGIGVGLSNNVKINGIKRLVPTYSTAFVNIVGQTGTIIQNGIVIDTLNNKWNLPASITIPYSGSVTVLATAQETGSIDIPIGAINKIGTPTLGWQSVSSTSASTPGNPVETDAALRKRQAISVAFPALTVNDSIIAGIANIPGVDKSAYYENPTGTTNSDGIPGHSIAVITRGGDPIEIANTIATRKTPGTGTYGTVTETVEVGNASIDIKFSPVTEVVLTATITIKVLAGYTSVIGDELKQRLVDYINTSDIGKMVELTQAYAHCVHPTYNLKTIAFGANGGAETVADVSIPYDSLATLILADIEVVLI